MLDLSDRSDDQVKKRVGVGWARREDDASGNAL